MLCIFGLTSCYLPELGQHKAVALKANTPSRQNTLAIAPGITVAEALRPLVKQANAMIYYQRFIAVSLSNFMSARKR